MSKIFPDKIANQESNEKSKQQNLYKIIKYVSRKFPSFLLFIHICISKYIIICNKHSHCNNNTIISKYESENNISSTYFWLYLSIMSVLCCIWEILYKYFKLKRKKKLEKEKIIYLIFSTIISLSAFLSTIFYVDDHHVFECFINYNKIIANTAFFISYATIVIFSVFEN